MTSVLVALGLARYTFLAWSRHGNVGRPEKVLLSDRLLWAVIAGYCLTSVLAVVFCR